MSSPTAVAWAGDEALAWEGGGEKKRRWEKNETVLVWTESEKGEDHEVGWVGRVREACS